MSAPNTSTSTSNSDFATNLAAVNDRIAAAAARAGRDAAEIRLLPVTKTVTADRLLAAAETGLDWMGENKVQEAVEKYPVMVDELGAAAAPKLAIIGPLQSNKTRDVARLAHEFQALDRVKIARRLNDQLAEYDRTLNVLVQINTSGEATKSGLNPEELPDFLDQVIDFDRLHITGLMTIAEHSDDETAIRDNFCALRGLRDQFADQLGPGELSMGMSADFEIAIEEGATIVRVGSALFGARDYSKN